MKAVEYRRGWDSSTPEDQEMANKFGELLIRFDTSPSYEVEESALFKNSDTFLCG